MPKGVYKRVKKIGGWKLSDKAKKNISKGHIGINTWMEGKKLSEKHRKNIGKGLLGKKNTLGKHWKVKDTSNYKYPRTEKYRERFRISQTGEGNNNWKGGFSREKHGNVKSVEWRIKIYIRDSFACQVCKKVGGKIQAHHIKRWSLYPELRYVLDNGITLCEDCHKLTDNFGNNKTNI